MAKIYASEDNKLFPKDKAILKNKGLKMMDQFITIDYHVNQAHLVGYLKAQTQLESKEELEKIESGLVDLAKEIFEEKPQKENKTGG